MQDDKSGVAVKSTNLEAIFAFDGNCEEEIRRNSGTTYSSNRITTDRHGRSGGAYFFGNGGKCRLSSYSIYGLYST